MAISLRAPPVSTLHSVPSVCKTLLIVITKGREKGTETMRRKIDHQIPQFLRNRRSLVIEVSVLLRSFEIYKDTQLMVVHQVSQK